MCELWGEVNSQAIKCPYCGSRNEEGISFYKEVYQRVNRNKLLAPILLRQKTPELIQRMLTRIIFAIGILGLTLFGIGLALILLINDPVYRDDKPDLHGYASEYVEIMEDYDNRGYQDWVRYSNEFLDRWNSGSKIEKYIIEMMLEYGFDAYYADRMDQQLQQQVRLEMDALLEGILQLNEEELALFHKVDGQSEYFVRPDQEAREQLVSLIEAKVAAREEAEIYTDVR